MKKIMIIIFLCMLNFHLNASYQQYYPQYSQPVQTQQNQIQYYYPQQHYYRQRIVNYTTIMHVHAQQRQNTLYNYYPGQQQFHVDVRVRPQITQARHVRPVTSQNLHNAIPVIALPFGGESSRIVTGQDHNAQDQISPETLNQEQLTSPQTSQNIMQCLLSCCCRRS